MQSTLEHFTIKKAMVFATGGNSSALFFFCGVARWGMWSVFVCCVCVEWACHVCICIWQRPSIKHGIRKFANKPDRMTLVASLSLPHARCRCTWQMPTIDMDSTRHQPYRTYPSPAHTSPQTIHPSPSHTGSLNQLSVLSNLPGTCLQPSNYSVQPFGSSPLICPTHPSMHACNPAYPDNWWAACATLCAFHFSLLALLCISLSSCFTSVSKEQNH